MNKELGFLAESEAATKILNGTYEFPPNLDPDMVKMLQQLGETTKTIQSNSTTATISPQDYITYRRGRLERKIFLLFRFTL